eukprot:2829759-Amphidinium_carterae.1
MATAGTQDARSPPKPTRGAVSTRVRGTRSWSHSLDMPGQSKTKANTSPHPTMSRKAHGRNAQLGSSSHASCNQ